MGGLGRQIVAEGAPDGLFQFGQGIALGRGVAASILGQRRQFADPFVPLLAVDELAATILGILGVACRAALKLVLGHLPVLQGCIWTGRIPGQTAYRRNNGTSSAQSVFGVAAGAVIERGIEL